MALTSLLGVDIQNLGVDGHHPLPFLLLSLLADKIPTRHILLRLFPGTGLGNQTKRVKFLLQRVGWALPADDVLEEFGRK